MGSAYVISGQDRRRVLSQINTDGRPRLFASGRNHPWKADNLTAAFTQENCKVGDWSIFRLKDDAMALDCCPKTWTCPPCV